MDASDRTTITPLLLSVAGLGLTLVVSFVLGSALGESQYVDAANVVVPLAILVVTTACAAAIVVRDPMAPWTPIPWFLLAMAAYFGLGALLNVLGNDDIISDAKTYYVINRNDLFKTNVLNLISIASVLMACAICTRLMAPRSVLAQPTMSPAGQTRVMWIFAIIGIPTKFLLAIPYQVGIYRLVLPGIVGGLAQFSNLFLLVICYRAASGSRHSVPWAASFALLSLVGDVLSFTKMGVLLTGLSAILGLYLARPARKTLFVGVVALVVVYLISVPFVSYARATVHGGAGGGAGVQERVSVTAQYLRGRSSKLEENNQAWWGRINLANVQSFAMTLYDTGAPGDTYNSVVYALVPRLLWPNKPILTPGTDFNYLASGNEESASTPGVFAEAYWNGGWLYVVAVSSYIGGVFAWIARGARRAMAAKDLRWLPCGFIGLLMVGPENFFVTTFIAGFLSALLYLFGLKLLVRDEIDARAPETAP